MPESILTALIRTVSSLLPNDPIVEHPKSVGALVSNAVDLLQGPGLAAGLACIPKTIYHRWTGESKCPQWSLPEELSVNLVRALATGDGSNDLTRMMIGVAAGFGAYSCGEPVESVKPLEYPVKGWWIGPPLEDKAHDLVILYIHGGAMVSGNPLQSAPGMATIVKNLRSQGVNARVFATWYPKAPDGPWPAGLEWCTRTYRWLVDVENYQNVIIFGDSAGGNLVLTTGLLLRDRHASTLQPLGLCPLSPWVDIESKTYAVRNIGVDYLTESPGGGSFQRYYTGRKYQFYKKRRTSLATVPDLFNLSKKELAELSEMQMAEVKRLEQEDAQRPIHEHAAFPSTYVPDDEEELEKRHHELARHPLVSPLYASFHNMPSTSFVLLLTHF
jgi:acetyl esterase/lipase